MAHGLDYGGKDLEVMALAAGYHRWILETFRPHFGVHAAEVGAGTGSFSELLLEEKFESLALIEPSKRTFEQLKERVTRWNMDGKIMLYNATYEQVAREVSPEPDSVIYVNVLEHIENDEAEIDLVYRSLPKHGRLFIFVPALRWLFGSLDAQVGHFRRYKKGEIEEKCQRAGFKILDCRYFDLAGIAPWWINYRLLKLQSIQVGAVKFYGRYIVPISKALESKMKPPLGKNLLLIAEKS